MSANRRPKRTSSIKPVTYLLKQLQNALRATLEEALAPTKLTLSEAFVLSELSLVPRSSNADLARASFVTPQSMVTMLKSLGTRGLIVRTANPKGGRAMPAELTADGAKKLMVFRLAMREVEHLLLRGLSAQDQTCFRDFLEHCLESLRSERSNT